jgi:hypothetical protein
MDCQC